MGRSKIIISGINGFVGRNLKSYLNHIYQIYGLSRTRNLSDNIFSYDENLIDILNKTYAFIHLAGKAHDLKKTTEENEYYKANTDLTIKLFNKFLESDCKVFIFMSSVKAVADSINTILTEDTIPNPITAYGKSKLKAEQYILNQKLPNNKRVYVLRPSMIHGPNNKGNLNLLFNFVNKGIPYPLGSYNNLRSFVSVENMCFIIKKLLNSEIKSGVYNIADSSPISTLDLIKIIAKADKKEIKIISIPKLIIKTIAKIGDIITFLPLNSERLEKLTENYIVDNAKIIKAIEGRLPLDVQQGLIKTIKSFD